jgi:hypothetical protein
MKLYNYNKIPKLTYTIKKASTETNLPYRYTLTYESAYKTGIKKNDKVYTELFLNHDFLNNDKNKQKKRLENTETLVILIHGFSSRKDKLRNYHFLINKITQKNLNCAFINLPFHLNRTPTDEVSGRRLLYFNDVETLEFFHQSVVDVRKFIDIILNIHPFKNIYICGLSLGGMVSIISMVYDRRIKKGIFLITGGNWKEIHWDGMLKFFLKGNCISDGIITKKQCNDFYNKFPKFLEELKKIPLNELTNDLVDFPELKKATLKMCFLCDPLAFAHKINPENVLMINSKFDQYFTTRSTTLLWEELGKPKIYWLNNLHTSKILSNSKVIKKITNFISQK